MVKTRRRIKHNKAILCAAALIAAVFLLSAFSFGRNGFADAEAEGGGQAADERVFDTAFDTEEGFAYGSGDGRGSPFLIATPAHLDNVRNYANVPIEVVIPGNGAGNNYVEGGDATVLQYAPGYHFEMVCDIDMAAYLDEGGAGYDKWGAEGWQAVDSFMGVFDGGFFTIRNLWIDRPQESYVGLFGASGQCVIKNIRLELADKGITGLTHVGGIAASIQNIQAADRYSAHITRCFVTGNIRAANEPDMNEFYTSPMSYAGGISGSILKGAVTQCAFFGSVSGLCVVGGITGENFSGEVSDCLSYAKISLVSGKDYIPVAGAGGIAGIAYGGGACIKNSYHESVQTDERVAAVLGFRREIKPDGGVYVTYAATPTIENCYYNGDIFTGQLTLIESTIAFFDNYENETWTEEFAPINSRALSADEAKTEGSFSGWDFASKWGFDKNGNLTLRAFGNAYDPPPPVPPLDLTWLWVALGCTAFGAAVISAGIILYRRKKAQIITNTVTEIVEKEKEIIIEVPAIKKGLPRDLSKRETQVAQLLLQGKSRREIVGITGLADNTVGTYIARVCTKAGADSVREFVVQHSRDNDIRD